MISELGFAVLVWGSLAIVTAVFGYVLLTTFLGIVRARRDNPDTPAEVAR